MSPDPAAPGAASRLFPGQRAAVAAVAAGAILAGAAVWLFAGGHSATRAHTAAKPGPAANSTPTLAAAAPLTAVRAEAMATDLRAGTDAAVRDAVVVPSGQPLPPAFLTQLRQLTALTVDVGSFHRVAADVGTVTVKLTGADGKQTPWVATLLNVGGQWKITTTTRP